MLVNSQNIEQPEVAGQPQYYETAANSQTLSSLDDPQDDTDDDLEDDDDLDVDDDIDDDVEVDDTDTALADEEVVTDDSAEPVDLKDDELDDDLEDDDMEDDDDLEDDNLRKV